MTQNKYKVELLSGNTYQVIELNVFIQGQSWDGYDDKYEDVPVFQGTISDCEAYIRLKEGGYL